MQPAMKAHETRMAKDKGVCRSFRKFIAFLPEGGNRCGVRPANSAQSSLASCVARVKQIKGVSWCGSANLVRLGEAISSASRH